MTSPSGPAPVRVRAAAKVNLVLRVGPQRGDGFHEIATVYQAVDLYDDVVAAERTDGVVSVETTDAAGRTVPGVADDDRHLALRAARALRRAAGVTAGAHLQVRKRIPVAAGLAGGSANAAAALVGCTALWGLTPDRERLLDLAAGLGSDVPFALVGGTALGTGRGERLDPLPPGRPTTWVLVTDGAGLATPAVYAETDRRRAGADVPAPQVGPGVLGALRRGELDRFAGALGNDLEGAAVALRPHLSAVLDAGRAAGAAAAMVSGSGPTVALLVADEQHAASVTAAVAPVAVALRPGAALRTVHGPVPGPAPVAGP